MRVTSTNVLASAEETYTNRRRLCSDVAPMMLQPPILKTSAHIASDGRVALSKAVATSEMVTLHP